MYVRAVGCSLLPAGCFAALFVELVWLTVRVGDVSNRLEYLGMEKYKYISCSYRSLASTFSAIFCARQIVVSKLALL